MVTFDAVAGGTGQIKTSNNTPQVVNTNTTAVTYISAQQGGDNTKLIDIDAEALAGPAAWRQGAIFILMNRAVGQDFTSAWDGNGDCGLKIQSINRAANAAGRGGVRAIDLQARNRSAAVVAWVYSQELNGRNDGTTDFLRPFHARAENYGVINTENLGMDVELSDENNSNAHKVYGLRIRNTDQSAQPAVTAAIDIRHTSTNGFTSLFNFNAATGDTVSVGSLKDSSAGDIKCVDRIAVMFNTAVRYIPLYDTLV